MRNGRLDIIEKAALEILQHLRIIQPPVSLDEVAKYLSLELVPSKFQSDEVCGVLAVQGKHGVIGYNSTHPKTRQRFSIAHEIGHYVIHVRNGRRKHGQEIYVDKTSSVGVVYFRDDKSTKGEFVQEIEANGFAAAILMPKHMVMEAIGTNVIDLNDESFLSELADTFGVSRMAMTYRIGRLYSSYV